MVRTITITLSILTLASSLCLANDAIKIKQTLGQDGLMVCWFHDLGNSGWQNILAASTEAGWVQPGIVFPTLKWGRLKGIPVLTLTCGASTELPLQTINPDLSVVSNHGGWETCNREVGEFDAEGKKRSLFWGRDHIRYCLTGWSLGLQDEWRYKDSFTLHVGPQLMRSTSGGNKMCFFLGFNPKKPREKKIYWEVKLQI